MYMHCARRQVVNARSCSILFFLLFLHLHIVVADTVSDGAVIERQASPAVVSIRPQDRLVGIGTALRQRDYKGVFSYEQQGRVSTLQWVHAVRDGIEHERLLGLDGVHREVLRERPLGCMRREERAIHTRLMDALTGDISSISSLYELTFDKPERVAGRESDVIMVKPRDGFRWGYRLFVDHDTGILLGADMLGATEKPVQQFRFLSIQIGAVTDADMQAITQDPVRMDMSHCQQEVAEGQADEKNISPWIFDVPPGYTLCSHESQREGSSRLQEDVQTFSDGLSHFTVFIHEDSSAAKAENPAHMQLGNTVLTNRIVEVEGGKYSVTIVGEVPDEIAKMVMTSLRRK
ncbi:MAG TPA: MucB/RseB C-terminal domain-containing protein [Pseudomonadales bacterium]|nr:MucB/RseB C-terminal domain-containing protein [Pseudomonadales bacterium]